MHCLTFLILVGISTLTYGKSKYYDGENRPYEFGFNIEGNQHRHESKDENGIIMGEFGFITADGYYHVTAYATDENGNFKILFMKNLKIGLPGEKQDTSALKLPTKPSTSVSARSPKRIELKPLAPGNTRACSGCAVPKMTVGGKSPYSQGVTALGGDPKKQPDPDRVLFRPLRKKLDATQMKSYMRNENLPKIDPRFGDNGRSKSNSFSPESGVMDKPNRLLTPPQQRIQSSGGSPGTQPNISKRLGSRNVDIGQPGGRLGGRKQNDRIGRKLPTDQEDGPHYGIAKDRGSLDEMRKALTGLLYKFNYTVGYHGHHEKGDFEGSKDGGYFINGRDGFRRNVEYLANEFGYQPYLTKEEISGADVPREETEKEAGLKGYEFKWFGEKEPNQLNR